LSLKVCESKKIRRQGIVIFPLLFGKTKFSKEHKENPISNETFDTYEGCAYRILSE